MVESPGPAGGWGRGTGAGGRVVVRGRGDGGGDAEGVAVEDLGGGLTMGMLLSAPLIVIGVALIGWSLRTKTAAGGPT